VCCMVASGPTPSRTSFGTPAPFFRLRVHQAVKLTLRRAWLLLGPTTATSSSVSLFARSHGAALTSIFLAGMWAVLIAPAAQAVAESRVVYRGEPSPMPKRVG
jgi:hypothetical protein